MSRQVLQAVLLTKEASLGPLRGSIIKSLGIGSGIAPRMLGATTGTAIAIPTLEAMGLSQSHPLFWGLSAASGVAGHDLVGSLASKRYKKFLESVS